MATHTSFVHPFTSTWIRPAILRRGHAHLIDAEHDLTCPTTRTSRRLTVTSNLFARRFLLRNRRTSFGSETVYYKPEEQLEEQAEQKEPDEPDANKEEKEPQGPTGPKRGNRLVLKRTGMNTPVVLSKKLQQFTGEDVMTRSKVISLLGNYIKENNLYLKGNRKRFVTDQFLSNLLGVDGDHAMLSLQRLISNHLQRPEEVGPEYVKRSEHIYQQYLKEKGAVDSKTVSARIDPRGLNSWKTQKELQAKGKGMYKAVIVDPCLRPILGGHETMSRPQMLKALWKYIKEENLQDPKNRRRIIVTEDLRNALKVTDAETIDCFHLGRYLWKLCKDPGAE